MDLANLRLGKELSVLGLEKELEHFTSAAGALDRALDKISATAVSPDRLIKVTVTGRGELRELELAPGVYGTQDPAALASDILTTIAQATATAAAKTAVAYDAFEEEVS